MPRMTSEPAISSVILAAGKGTRMGSDRAKVLHELAGRPLVGHVLDACRAAGFAQQVVVVGHQRELVEAAVAADDVDCVLQAEQLGTGHAVGMAADTVRHPITVVLCGDAPLVTGELLRQLVATHRQRGASATVVAAELEDPTGYGRIVCDADGDFASIVEQRDASEAERAIRLVNSGIMAFASDRLFPTLARLRPDNAQGEYYLTDVPAMLRRAGERVGVHITDDPRSVVGINTPEQLATAEALFASYQDEPSA